ncbi:MAG TPA: serine/threonine-protein kinase [Thermoanaerobaculia bacterium]|jgi:serine/threonine protein kinase|nr:serine/threonine-protein kinase [Thermoanaerobaculia bacterium]
MTPETWHRVEAIVTVALGLPVEGRPEFLEIACKNDTDLRDQVDRLLSGYRAQSWSMPPVESMAMNRDQGESNRSVLRKPLGREKLGSWTLQEVISRGGMGVVFSAKRSDGLYDQDVAVKILGVDLLETAAEEWFVRERRVLARLNHPGIVKVFDGGTTPDGRPFIVMERVDGLPIDRHCAVYNLSTDDRIKLFLEVCKAIEHAHENSVIHRDLKPSNILVDRHGHPRILDFGIARSGGGSEPPAAFSTRQAMTLAYASPEQIRGQRCTAASDVYSLGVVLYELVSGRKPFEGRSPAELRQAILNETPKDPCGVFFQKNVLVINSIAQRCLERVPEKRYLTVASLRLDLEKALEEREARVDSAWYQAEVPLVSKSAVTLIVTLLVLGFVMWVVVNFVIEVTPRIEASQRVTQRATDYRWTRGELSSGFPNGISVEPAPGDAGNKAGVAGTRNHMGIEGTAASSGTPSARTPTWEELVLWQSKAKDNRGTTDYRNPGANQNVPRMPGIFSRLAANPPASSSGNTGGQISP